MKNRFRNYLINLVVPAFVFGSITGVLTALTVVLYKLCATHIIHFSELGYAFLRGHLYLLPVVLVALFGIACLFAYVYKRVPNLRGGGIPTSVGILRGIITFKWLRNLLGVFTLSLVSFLLGVPLGNEGPSVQMGTAIGRGSVYTMAKKNRAWDRYSMTGGACAGFSVATGAPLSGIMFAVEEAHQRVSPMIIIVSTIAVLFARITAELLSPLLGVSVTLFPEMRPLSLSLSDIWVPVVIGLAIGLFAVLFLNYHRLIHTLLNKKLRRLPHRFRIFFIFCLTLVLGLCSFSFISTGHELILSLFEEKTAIYMLLLLLLARATLSLGANATGISGGMFLPTLALGTLLSSLLGRVLVEGLGLGADYYAVILLLGITACIAGMMKMPLTAIVFALEALSCYENLLHVIVVAGVAYIMAEIFSAKSINDNILDIRVEECNEGRTAKVFDTFVTVQKGAFAIGKQIRDIFWPANLFVLSIQHSETRRAEVDEHGGKAIREGDILHVRYSTYDEESTKEELTAIVGEQTYRENEAEVI